MQSVRAKIHVLSDYVSDDYSTDDGTECDKNCVQPREVDPDCAEDATPDCAEDATPDYCCSKVDAADICFHW